MFFKITALYTSEVKLLPEFLLIYEEELIFSKFSGLQPANLLKINSLQLSLNELVYNFRNYVLQNTSKWLLLSFFF